MSDKKKSSPIQKTRKSIQPSSMDNFVGFFSPKARAQRIRAKIATDILVRKYEGASKGRRTDSWRTPSTSVNVETAGAMRTLRDRARDLVRNNPYAKKGLGVISNGVVGKGIMGQVKMEGSDTVARTLRLKTAWDAWAGTTACDYEGRKNLNKIQSLIMRGVPEGGEILVRVRRTNRRQVMWKGEFVEVPPIELQLLEGDFIDSSRLVQQLENGNRLLQGIEFTPDSKRFAYHLHKSHPGGLDLVIEGSFDTVSVPANEIIHVYNEERAGQIRGVTWFSPSIIRMRDFDEYEDAQLVRQKVAAMFTAFVHDLEGLDEDTKESDIELCEKMEPGLIEILPPGKEVTLAKPPGAENYDSYSRTVLRGIASGLEITYEAMTGDLSNVNFSSARMGWIQMDANFQTWRSDMMITQFLNPVWNWFLQGAQLIGLSTNGATVTWSAPRREMIDPTKEVPATREAVRSGQLTLSESIRQTGKDPETHLREIAEDNKLLDELGLTLDSDPRKVSKGGGTATSQPNTEGN